MPTVLCSTGCGTNLGNFNPTPYGSLSCQVCFTNGAYIRHLAATYSLVDKGVHDKILERLNAEQKTQNTLRHEIRSLKQSLKNKKALSRQEQDRIINLLVSETLSNYSIKFIEFIASIRQNKLNFTQILEASRKRIIQQLQVKAMTIIAQEVQAINSEIKIRSDCNDTDIQSMETLRENVKRAISAPNKAMPDEEGDKLISGEKQVEFQNLFNHLIQERLEKKTMLSGLLKTGENITAIQIKRYPREEAREIQRSK